MNITTKLHEWKRTVFVIVLLFLFSLLFVNLKGILLNCFHVMDFGIYQQAIYEIAGNLDFNPYLTVRNINIFNDHVDPVLFLAMPFAWLTNYSATSLIIFEFLWFLGLFILIYKRDNKEKIWPMFFLIVVFTKGLLTGVGYPIHPTTWSMLPAFFLAISILEDKKKNIFILSFFLLLFKETFAFAIIGLSFFYLLRKDYKFFLSLFGIALLNMFFVFYIRPRLLGPVYPHASIATGELPWSLINKLLEVDVKAFLKVFYPFFIPLFLIFKQKWIKKEWISLELGVLLYILPNLGIQWLANKIHFQYGVLIVSPLLALIFYSKERDQWLKNNKILVITLLLFIGSGMGSHTKNVKNIFASKKKSCTFDSDRLSSLSRLNNYLGNEKGPILSTGGAIPGFLRPGMKAYQVGMFRKILDSYEFMLIEKPGTGNHFPFSNEQISAAISKCQNEDKIMDDQWFLLVKNPSPSCFKTLQ